MRPLVEALVDHHQDTAELAADETKRARYVTTVLARLVCILHGHTRCDVSASEVLDSNIADVFRVCTRRTLDHVVPFRPAEADAIAHRFDAIDRHGRGIIEFADVEAHYEGWLRAGSPYPAPFVVPLELVRRAMQGHARQLASGRTGYFCFRGLGLLRALAQADSMADTSIDYWFRLLDEDGDGVLSHADLHPHAMASSPPRHHGVWDETTAPPPITALFLKWARLGNQLFDAFVRLYSRHPDRTERAKDWHQRVAAHSPPLPDPADTDDDAVS
ncbi:hypothetical protein FNF28_07698 [Cafeteria roenbergensis]|uniref:EF-hand domain-containing protein n=1 Tax=Cafeteria roenbergensis TaxID=33653 RepID=A0A5A8BZW5_CAFRO|nr:hypothetical protein FNF28_07698 [Cafeteria roenbergensis]